MPNPVDLRGDFETMLEVDIAYINWLARNGAAELYYPQILNEIRSNTTEAADTDADSKGSPTSFVSQAQILKSSYGARRPNRLGEEATARPASLHR